MAYFASFHIHFFFLLDVLYFSYLIIGPCSAFSIVLRLPKVELPDNPRCCLVRVAVVAPVENSDHSSLLAVISIAQAVPNLCVSGQVFLKHQVNWNTVCGAIQDLPWCVIWLADNPVNVLNEHLSLLV